MLFIITLTLYGIYCMYITLKQLNEGTDADYSPIVRLILLFIPIVNFVVIWWLSHDAEAVTGHNDVLLFTLAILPPAFWYLIQSCIDDVAESA